MKESTKAAVMALARYQRTAAGIDTFERIGYDGETLIPAFHEDTIAEVMERVHRHSDPPVVIAVHFPRRQGTRQWRFLSFRPSSPEEIAQADPNDSAKVDASIGMLADSIKPGAGRTVRLVWESVDVRTFELV